MGHLPLDLVELQRALQAWADQVQPGWTEAIITLKVADGTPLRLPFRRSAMPASRPVDTEMAFIPNPFQQAILDALEGKALRTDALGAAVGDRARLYRPNGLRELRDHGLVAHHERLGFFRPDAPPDELAGEMS